MQRELDISNDSIDRLKSYDYPGNIRELRNISFIAAAHAGDSVITGDMVDRVIEQIVRDRPVRAQYSPHLSGNGPQQSPDTEAVASLQDNEAKHIASLLEHFNGNRRQVAGSLGISERTLYRKLKKFGLG